VTGQWEHLVAQAAEAIKTTPWKRTDFVDEDGNHDYMASEDYEAEARAVLATVGPLIAEDTRERMVAAAGAALERIDRGEPRRLAVSEYTVYPTGYHATEIPSDKYHFVITVKDRGKGWAVCWMSDVLNRSGEWEWEMQPSSRDDDFFSRCRFTEEEAKRLAVEAVDKLAINGRTFAEAVRWVRERT